MMAFVLTLGQAALAGKSTPSPATDAPSEVHPQVAIALPEAGFATNAGSIEVVVSFAAKEENGKPAGNVKTVILRLGDKEVERYQNPPRIKSGTVKFLVDVSGLPDGRICFTAVACQGAVSGWAVQMPETNCGITRLATTHYLAPGLPVIFFLTRQSPHD
ncbi:MAG: hypothetical protein HYU36_00475 [Planctomycetes bacterium]|nr:hypothetical protein [Planctomycetota bacterium]